MLYCYIVLLNMSNYLVLLKKQILIFYFFETPALNARNKTFNTSLWKVLHKTLWRGEVYAAPAARFAQNRLPAGMTLHPEM